MCFMACFPYGSGLDPCYLLCEGIYSIVIIIIIIVHLRMQPEGYGAAIYIFWAPGPYRIFVSPVSSLAVLRGPPLLSLDFCLHSAF